jgi:hypothetical protein
MDHRTLGAGSQPGRRRLESAALRRPHRLPPGHPRAGLGRARFAFLDPFGSAWNRDQLVEAILRRAGLAPVEVLHLIKPLRLVWLWV